MKEKIIRVKLIKQTKYKDWWYAHMPLGLTFDVEHPYKRNGNKQQAYLAKTDHNDKVLSEHGKPRMPIKNLINQTTYISYESCYIDTNDWGPLTFDTNEEAATLLSKEEIE